MPTLLSALQLRRSVPADRADVLVVCFGPATETTACAAAICAEANLRFVLVPGDILGGSPLICARFFLTSILDARYTDIVYLDGDTQVVGSLLPLLDYDLASGTIIAVPDPMAVMIDRQDGGWPARRAYFAAIGLTAQRQRRYFNSGVMRFRRGDWDVVSRDCLALCRERGTDFDFRDQDALNIVVGDGHRPMSFRWNFPPFFLNFGADRIIAPRIYHFMSNPRPWHGAFAPWGRAWHEPYVAFAAAHPGLARSLKCVSGLRLARYAAQQRLKRFVEARVWGTSGVRARIEQMENEAVV